MKNIIRISLATSLLLSSSLLAQELETEKRTRIHSVRKVVDQVGKIDTKEISEVDKVRKMFSDGSVSGQLRIMYAESPEPQKLYTTATGGIIKYELAEYHGLNAGAAVYTSYDMPFLSGSAKERYTDLSSSNENHTDMSEAYLNYKYQDLNIRVGRQVIDTPLADSDDIRMIQNSFEAYIATYNVAGIEFMAGHLQKWHGVDAELDNDWTPAGEDGTNFGGLKYHNVLEFSAWYYNIPKMTNAAYFDLGVEYPINKDFLLHIGAQYLNETELEKSGTAASIYGALVEVVAYDIGFNLSFNKSQRRVGKDTFSGFGGGTLYTSMDTSILNDITADRDALSIVTGLSYTLDKIDVLYAYGDFSGGADSLGQKEHRVEQDIGAGYNFNDEFVVSAIYADMNDKENPTNSWNRVQVMVNYNF